MERASFREARPGELSASKAQPARGDLWWFEAGSSAGAENAGKPARPYVIISTDVVNELRYTVVGVPLTTGGSGKPPLNIPISAAGRRSYAVIDQIRALDKKRMRDYIGAVSPSEMEAIEEALREILEL